MGGEPWMYFVPFERELQAALDKLKDREFKAGRYNPVMRRLPFPVDPSGPAPGAKHRSIAAARDAADADGTRSILDMDRVVSRPPRGSSGHDAIAAAMSNQKGNVIDLSAFMASEVADYGVISPVPREVLQTLYGTDKPTRAAVQQAPDFLDDVDRGKGVYIVLYEDGEPTEICFAGYSYD